MKIKAAFILIVFSLNMILGFACAVGCDLGFNSHHHEEIEMTDFGKCHHHGKAEKGHKDSHHSHAATMAKNHEDSHQHGIASETKSHEGCGEYDGNNDNTATESKDNCCNDEVIKFAKVDKLIAHSFHTAIFFVTLIPTLFYIDVLNLPEVSRDIKYFVRSYHPPIPDIRIAIQSFQI